MCNYTHLWTKDCKRFNTKPKFMNNLTNFMGFSSHVVAKGRQDSQKPVSIFSGHFGKIIHQNLMGKTNIRGSLMTSMIVFKLLVKF